MKKLLCIFVFALSAFISLNAQDIITKKDGTDIPAKILEVNIDEVKYKRYSNLEGPTYTILKSDILIVRYENGENEVFNAIDQRSIYKANTTQTVVPGMKYREYKDFYDTQFYVPQPGDPYSRGWAGVASSFIPGLGECIDGEWGRGLAFFCADVGLSLLGISQITAVNVDNYGNTTYQANGLFWSIQVARIALNIWSICDAVHIAKVKNMYYQDLRGQRASLDFNIEPFITYAQAGMQSSPLPVAGLSMRVSF